MSKPVTVKDAPAFDFYPERWTHGTRHMTKIERCDYLDLLAHQWTDDGLPSDLDMLARLIGYKKGAQIPALVLEKFPIAEDGKRRNTRLEAERQAQRNRIARKRAGATKTNQKRWGNNVADESLSDHSATIERVDIESPPPTTRHPPLEKAHSRAGEAPSLEQVHQWAESVMAPKECVELFWNDMEACDWLDAKGRPITNPRSAFNSFAIRWKGNEHLRKAKQGLVSHPSPTAHQAKPPGLFGSSMDKYRTDKKEGQP